MSSSTGYPFDYQTSFSSKDYEYFGTITGLAGMNNLKNTVVATLQYSIQTGNADTTCKPGDGSTLYTSTSNIVHRNRGGSVSTDLNNMVAVVTVTLNGSVLSSNGTTYGASLSNYTFDPPARVLNHVQIFPRNQVYRETTVGGSAYIYSGVGFYNDRQTVDFSQQVTWRVEDDANPGVPLSGTSFSGNTLFVNRNSPPLLRITCSLNGVDQDTVKASVVAPSS